MLASVRGRNAWFRRQWWGSQQRRWRCFDKASPRERREFDFSPSCDEETTTQINKESTTTMMRRVRKLFLSLSFDLPLFLAFSSFTSAYVTGVREGQSCSPSCFIHDRLLNITCNSSCSWRTITRLVKAPPPNLFFIFLIYFLLQTILCNQYS